MNKIKILPILLLLLIILAGGFFSSRYRNTSNNTLDDQINNITQTISSIEEDPELPLDDVLAPESIPTDQGDALEITDLENEISSLEDGSLDTSDF
jgi:hypothetical protein